MEDFDDSEMDGIEELVGRFKTAVDENEPLFWDEDELQDIIEYLLEELQFSYAQKAINIGVKQYPDDPYFRLLLAKWYAMQDDVKSAERELDYLESHFDPIPELYVERVLISHTFERDVEAKKLLNKALALDDNMPEAHLLLAHEYITDHNISQAVQHAIRAIQLDPLAAEDLNVVTINLGALCRSDKDNLIDFFTAMTEKMPMVASLWSGLGMAYMSNDMFEKAAESFEFQISLDPDDAMAYVNLAESLSEMGKYAEAIANFKIANEKCNIIQFNMQIGRCYHKMNDLDNALKYFSKIHTDDPMFPFVVLERVNILKKQARFDEARTCLRNFLKMEPNDLEAIEGLIELLPVENNMDEIQQLCYNALQQDEFSKYRFLFFLTSHCYHCQCPDLAIDICEKYEVDEEMYPSLQYFLAALYVRKGMFEKGFQHLELALQADSDRVEADFLDIDEALADFPEVIELLRIYCPDYDLEMLN